MMKTYLVGARLRSREDAIKKIESYFKLRTEPYSLINKKKHKNDITAVSIEVLELTWRAARELEKYLNLPMVYIVPHLTNRKFKFKLVVPLRPDDDAVILGLDAWALKLDFSPSRTTMYLGHQRTVAYLKSKADAEELKSLLMPFSEETSLTVSHDLAFLCSAFFGLLFTVSLVLFLLALIPKQIFVISLTLIPLGIFAFFGVVYRLIYPPIFALNKAASTKTEKDFKT